MGPTTPQTQPTTQPSGNLFAATGGVPVEGAWYGGQRYMGGRLLAPGQDQPGHDVSAEVIAQTNPNNVDFVNKQRAAAGLPPAPGSPATDTNPSATSSTANPTGTPAPQNADVTASKGKIADFQNQIAARQTAAANAIKEINDNPFYAEATRVGKIAKVNDALNADLAPLTQQLTAEQANYDALVKSATPNTEVVQSTDDNGNLTLLTVNKNTGQTIASQTIAGVGKAKAASATDTKDTTANQNMTNAIGDIKHGATLQQVVDHYGVAGGLSIDQIYQLYNENTTRGQAKETLAQVKQGQYATQKGFVSAK